MPTRLDLESLRELAKDRIGDILLALGARARGTPERGRATAPDRDTKDFNLAYGSGCVTDHVTGETMDALGLVARVRGHGLRDAAGLREAADELAAILGRGIGQGQRQQLPPARAPRRRRDASRLWRGLAGRDLDGERYLAGRRLCPAEMRLVNDLVRFNVGQSGDGWLDARAMEGFRVAFPVRKADGGEQSLSLRFSGQGGPPAGWDKTIALAGCEIGGGAVCRPNIGDLASGDPEFMNDELIVVEGGPDCLAATLAFDEAGVERLVPPAWALGAIGVSNVAGMLSAFAPVVRGRVVHIAIDADEKGESSVPVAVEAALAAGARRVTRMRPPLGTKDIAEAWESACG
jgi:hypothetical protein